jgi:hypothetical protein
MLLRQKGTILNIASDANSFFIKTILNEHCIFDLFTEIVTNPAHIDAAGYGNESSIEILTIMVWKLQARFGYDACWKYPIAASVVSPSQTCARARLLMKWSNEYIHCVQSLLVMAQMTFVRQFI